MTQEFIKNLLEISGFILAIFEFFVAGSKKNVKIISFALALIIGGTLYLNYLHEREVLQVEREIRRVLSGNRWTSEQIFSAMHEPDYKLFHEALSRAVENGIVGNAKTSCVTTTNGSFVLDTQVYF